MKEPLNRLMGLAEAHIRNAGNAGFGFRDLAARLAIEHLARIPADNVEIELDFSDRCWQTIFQDIVRRSPSLCYVTAVSSFTCTKMRPDGFGGMAVLITADAVMGKSTSDIVADFLTAAVRDRAHEPPKPCGQ